MFLNILAVHQNQMLKHQLFDHQLKEVLKLYEKRAVIVWMLLKIRRNQLINSFPQEWNTVNVCFEWFYELGKNAKNRYYFLQFYSTIWMNRQMGFIVPVPLELVPYPVTLLLFDVVSSVVFYIRASVVWVLLQFAIQKKPKFIGNKHFMNRKHMPPFFITLPMEVIGLMLCLCSKCNCLIFSFQLNPATNQNHCPI